MFRKRVRREFPPGTFIAMPKRIVAILQLCFAFTAICAAMSAPFLGELFTHKSQMLLYQNVMGSSVLAEKLGVSNEGHFQRNATRFVALPEAQRLQIIHDHDALQTKAEKPFLDKFGESFRILCWELPPFERAWILLAVLIPILLLLRRDGAAKAAWLLPIVAALYSFDNFSNGKMAKPSPDAALFPTEQVILRDYLQEPLSESILEQQKQLTKGWHLYLIKNWARQEPSDDHNVFSQQVEEGEYAFNVARLGILSKEVHEKGSFYQRRHLLLLILFPIWNLFFVWVVNRK